MISFFHPPWLQDLTSPTILRVKSLAVDHVSACVFVGGCYRSTSYLLLERMCPTSPQNPLLNSPKLNRRTRTCKERPVLSSRVVKETWSGADSRGCWNEFADGS